MAVANKQRPINQSISQKLVKNYILSGISKISCFYVNARSLISKTSELELYINEEHPYIIGITESWAYGGINDSELNIDGYTMFRKDRAIGTKIRGGGVLLYIRNSLNAVIREDFIESDFTECVWCELLCETTKPLVGICYRPPDSLKCNDKALFRLINKASKEKT